jgi:hypothetical protein
MPGNVNLCINDVVDEKKRTGYNEAVTSTGNYQDQDIIDSKEVSMPRVAVILADGFEEVEAVAIIDVLRRAGIETVVAGLHDGPVASARMVR